jgi:hypothetical protein
MKTHSHGIKNGIEIIENLEATNPEEAFVFVTHGGARIGSGRKSNNRVTVSLRLSPETISRLKTQSKQLKVSMSDLVEKKLKNL